MINIAEVKEILISHDEYSWEIGELISDGWVELSVVEIGSSPDYEYEHHGQLCILGRPNHIVTVKRGSQMCLSLIQSGRRSDKCELGTTCSVDGCKNQAEYEVIFYDYYTGINSVHFAQDYTCPFICDEHMQENEAGSRGIREPRSHINYPFTKRHGGQAYTKYLPARFVEIHSL